jgi:hypothetical protein
MQYSKIPFLCENSSGHAKEFLRKLSTFLARSLKNVRRPCARRNWKLVLLLRVAYLNISCAVR